MNSIKYWSLGDAVANCWSVGATPGAHTAQALALRERLLTSEHAMPARRGGGHSLRITPGRDSF